MENLSGQADKLFAPAGFLLQSLGLVIKDAQVW
jgi:hypothetical protein